MTSAEHDNSERHFGPRRSSDEASDAPPRARRERHQARGPNRAASASPISGPVPALSMHLHCAASALARARTRPALASASPLFASSAFLMLDLTSEVREASGHEQIFKGTSPSQAKAPAAPGHSHGTPGSLAFSRRPGSLTHRAAALGHTGAQTRVPRRSSRPRRHSGLGAWPIPGVPHVRTRRGRTPASPRKHTPVRRFHRMTCAEARACTARNTSCRAGPRTTPASAAAPRAGHGHSSGRARHRDSGTKATATAPAAHSLAQHPDPASPRLHAHLRRLRLLERPAPHPDAGEPTWRPASLL